MKYILSLLLILLISVGGNYLFITNNSFNKKDSDNNITKSINVSLDNKFLSSIKIKKAQASIVVNNNSKPLTDAEREAKIKDIIINRKIKILRQQIKKNKKEGVIHTKRTKLDEIPIPIQTPFSNTCVIDNISYILEYTFGKKLDKEKVYKDMGKVKGDYWRSGALTQTNYGGKITPIDGHKDYLLFEDVTNIYFYDSSNVKYMKDILQKSSSLLLMEVPMSVLYANNPQWKLPNNENVYHAITLIGYNSETNNIEYINTLNGKKEYIHIDKLKANEDYLKYPYKYVAISNNDIKMEYFLQ